MKLDVNALMRCIIFLVVATAGLVLVQMWFHVFSTLFFWKALVTLIILGVVASIVIAVRQDMTEEKKLKDDKYLD